MNLLPYLMHLGILLSIYIILSLAFQLSIGYTGLINLGIIALFGVGAYASALFTLRLGLPIGIGIFLAMIVTCIFGVILALPTNKIKGDYLALVTLGFAFIMDAVARNWTSLTDGALGLKGVPRIFPLNSLYLALVVLLATLVYLILKGISASNFGKSLQAARDDELAASVLGKNVHLYKMAALGICGLFAGLAGGLYAHYITFIDPTVFNLNDVILMLAMVVVGGLGSLQGAVLGAVIIFLLPEPLRFIGLPSSLVGPIRLMMFAVILLLIMIYKPKGLLGKVDLDNA